MKKMKKFMSLLMAAVMVLSVMTVNVFAEDTATGEGSITITDTKNNVEVGLEKGVTYNIYRLFELTLGAENKNGEFGTYSYKVTEAWKPFFEAAGAKYIKLDNNGYVVGTVGDEMGNNGSRVAALAMEAADYAAKNKITSTGTDTTKTEGDELLFDNLPLGYYLITSTYGSSGIRVLTTTDKNATVDEKNIEPGINKFVKEDGEWVKANDAAYGDELEFKIDITVEKDATGYVLTDVMDAGLKYKADSVAVKIGDRAVAESKYTLSGVSDEGFTITFGNLETTEKQIVTVTYFATVDHGADVNEGIVNTATLDFGNDGSDDDKTSSTETYTWDIDVYKFTGTEENKTDLAGAEFVLMNKEKNAYYFYGEKEVNGEVVTVMDWVTDKDKATVLTSGADGIAVYGDLNAFIGLDSGTYYLEEIAAPDGYNMLVDYVEVVINAITTNDETGEVENTSGKVTSAGDEADVEVLNSTGAELPETGGIGTMIFRVGGAALIIIAGALLVAKKRTNNI